MSNDHLKGAQNSKAGSNGQHADAQHADGQHADGRNGDRRNGHGQRAVRSIDEQAAALRQEWAADPRWAGVDRSYPAADVIRLRGSVQEEHTLARIGAERLWSLLRQEPYISTLGALTGNQAVQQVRAGLKAIYLSGW